MRHWPACLQDFVLRLRATRRGTRESTGFLVHQKEGCPQSKRFGSKCWFGGSMVKLPRDWKELIGYLCERRVRFLVVGAHALAVHWRPRATGDLDILVEPTRANAARLAKALGDFGFPGLAAAAMEFARPDRMATMGREPLRIDVMSSISGVSFSEAWRGRVRVVVGKSEVGFLGLRQFIANKKASGRAKDLLDLALLAEVDRDRLVGTTLASSSRAPRKSRGVSQRRPP